jgi:hypothetical protein
VATLADRHLDVQDGARTAVVAVWQPALPDEAIRDHLRHEDFATMTGRKVFIYGPENGANEVEAINRVEVINGFKVNLEIFEKFEEAGRPPKAWVDERVSFVDTVYTAIDKVHGSYLIDQMWTETLTIVEMTNLRAVEQLKFFAASIEVEFREIATG